MVGCGMLCVLKEGDLLGIGEEVEIGVDVSVIFEFVDVFWLQLCEGLCLCLDQFSCYGCIGMVDICLCLEQGCVSNWVILVCGLVF